MFPNAFKDINIAHDNIHGHLRSTYSREKYYKKPFYFIESVEIRIPIDENEEPYFHHYVPILKTIKKLFCNEEILNYCSSSGTCDIGIVVREI